MRCFICDSILGKDEVKYNRDHQEFDPCGTCLAAIAEVFEQKDEDMIDRELTEDQIDRLILFFDPEDLPVA